MTDNRSLVDTYKSVIQPEAAPNPAKDFQTRYRSLLANDAADAAHANVLSAPVAPDQAAKANAYARDLGLPAAAIDGQTHLYDQRKQAQEAADAARAHPNIARALADPRTAAAAADDTPALRAISQQFQNFWKSKPQPKSWWQTIKDVPGEVGGALLAGGEQLSQSVVDAAKSVVDVSQMLDPVTYINRALAPKGITPEQVDAVSGYGLLQGALGKYSKFIGAQADAAAPDLAQAGYVHRNLIQGIENVPSSVAALGATVMGHPKAGLALLGGTTYGQSYRQAREAGVSVPGAINYSLAQAGIEVATEKIPVMKFLEDTKVGTPFFKRLLKNFAAENVGEQAATVLQNFNQWAVIDSNQGKTFGDYLKEIPDQAAQTALAVASMVGTSNVAIAAGEQTVRAVKAVDRIRTAKADAAALGGIIDGAAASKLRQRDPETFRQFVQQTAEGTTAENVHIPAEAISTYMQSEDFKDEDGFFASIAPQVSEALATGGDVVVPTSDVATKLAGTKAWAALKDDARLSPGGLSIRETREQEAEIRKNIETVGAAAIDQANQQAVADTPRDQVFNDVRDRLMAIGFTKSAASAHAELMAANAETMGAMFGQTALEYHQANPVDYVREGMAAAKAAKGSTVLDQPDNQAFKNWFGDSKVVDNAGAPLVVYHGTTADFTAFDRKLIGSKTDAGWAGEGFYFSSDPTVADAYGNKKIAAYLSIKNPYQFEGNFYKEVMSHGGPAGFSKWLRSNGYDGVKLWSQFMVLDPEQIKSVNNQGTFDPLDANIFRQPAPALTSLPASSPGPFQPAREAAERYASRAGLPYSPPTNYAPVDKERAARIAQAFEEMSHAPNDPEVRAAYDAMVDETLAQWREVEMSGLVVEFVDGEDPYGGNPWGAVRDVRDNNHLWVFNTEDGYGQGGITPEQEAENPMLAIVPGMSWSGKQVRVNDVFRAVHDYFGHIKEGVGFRARGEENAWRSHSAMYSPLARRAMTTETRGQNSWLNFGPYAESNRTASVEDTVFAEQKIGLLPQWVTDEGALEDNAADKREAARSFKGTQVVDDEGKPRVVYHGTPFTFDDFRNRPKLDWFAERPETAAGYADPRRVRKIGGANIRPVYLDIRNPFVIEQEPGTVRAQDWLEQVGLPRDLWPNNETTSAQNIFTHPDVTGELKRRGFDGIRVPEGSSVTWAPFSRAQIASIFDTPRVLFQQDVNPVFYSALARTVELSQTAKASAAQWKATLQNAPGVKAEELEWSGLLDILDFDPKAVFTKEQVAEGLRNGAIHVDEVVNSAEDAPLGDWKSLGFSVDLNEDEEWDVTDPDGNPVGTYRWHDDAVRAAAEEASYLAQPATQFQEYSSDPNSNSYRELLLTLPAGQGNNPDRAPDTHWDQPRVVAHARFSEKQDVDGKRVLFIEEVQSDWHQKGRTQGYQQPVDPKRVEEAQAKFDATKAAYDAAFLDYEDARRAGREPHDRARRLLNEEPDNEAAIEQAFADRRAAQDAVRPFEEKAQQLRQVRDLAGRELDIAKGLITNGGIPNAPFKTTWPQLVMKRMIRWAADNGFDRIAWINGDQQNGGVTEQDEGVKHFYENILPKTVQKLIGKFGGKVDRSVEFEGGALGNEGATVRFNLRQAQQNLARAERLQTTVDELDRLREQVRIAQAIYNKNAPSKNRGFDLTPELRAAAGGGFPLFQNNNGPRGQIALHPDRSTITLFENADASTLIHETGHLFLERLKRAAQADNASQQTRDDWAAVHAWFKDQNVPVTSDGSIPREAHELFARGFERYAMEGKAPAKRLERAFTAFRSWLLHIYQVVQNLRSPITPQVREVFGRMLATQQAIDEYAAEQHTKSLFATPEEAKKAVDMGPDEFAVYARTVIEARDAAFDALLFKTMHRIKQRVLAERRAEVTAARKAATDATDAEPRFRALRLLRTGQIDGAKTDGVLIDRAWLEEHLGVDFADKLPKGPIIYKNGGLHPDEIADMTGFGSGAEMVDALVALADEKRQMEASGDKRQPRDRAVDERVNALLDSKSGSDPLKDGSIEAEAVAAIQNDKLGEQIAYETRVLARRTKGRPTPYKLAREWAKAKIEAGKVNDVASRSAIQRYTRAAAKAARLAEEAILKGDIDETFRQKQAQMLNHALAVEANLAADEVDTIVARMKRLSSRATMKSIDQDYFDRVQDLLEQFDFKPQSQRALDERESFAEWAANRQAQGFEVHIPPRLLETADHYSRVSVQELYGLRDTVDSLMKLGRLKQSILDAKNERDFQAYVDDVMAHIRELPTRKLNAADFNEDSKSLRGFNAELIKIETIANELDNGNPNGPLTRLLVHRANDAENKRHTLRESVLSPIAKAYLGMPKKQRLRLEEKVTIPELIRHGSDIDPRAGGPVVMTRMELLAVALNTGNASNMDKLSRGERWPAQTIRDVLNRELTKADWDFVQSMWDAIDSLWPEIAATERRMSGVVPEKVEATPIATPHGSYRGGYYPVVYDFDRSQQAENYRADDNNDLFGYASGVSTPKGHTIARTNARGPIRLSVEQVLFRHVEKVIARIAYAEYARDVLRVIENPKVRDGIDLKLGKEYRKQIKPWLKRVISSGAAETRSAEWTQRFFRTARTNMTIAVMGFKASVGIAQTLGLTASAGQIGGWRVAQGVRDILGDLARGRADFQQFIFDRSPEMERRGKEVNREIANLNAGIRAKTGLLHTARSAAMWHIAMIDRYMVAMPTWLGAHRKAIDEGMTDEQASRYADAMVRQSQGSGAEKDLAAVQSNAGGEFQKWLTLFYTYFNVQHNAAWQAKRAAQKGNYKRAIQLTGWFLLAAPLADAIVSGDLPTDDSDPEAWFGWFLRNVFFNLFAGVPGVRDAGNFAERKISGQYSTAAFSPLDRLTDIGQRAAQEGYDVYSGEPVDGNTIRTAVSTPGYVFGLPSEQPAATSKFLWDYEHGDSDPKSVTDWYYGLTKGKVPADKQGN